MTARERRTAERLVFAPDVPGLAALGVDRPELLFEGELGPRAELLSRSAGELRLRVPLPGTPGADGRLRGRPGGAGTGWVVLQAWRRPPLRALLSARFTDPRSASLGERAWNLLCHLRAAGVGTPEPLAVGTAGNGLAARRSFLVTRELRGFVPLTGYAPRACATDDGRARAVLAAGTFFKRLLGARYAAPRLTGETVRVREEIVAPGECDDDGAPAGLTRVRAPGFALADVGGGRITRRFEPRDAARMLLPLAAELAERGVPTAALLAVLRRATSALPAVDRRALFSALRRARA